MDLYQLEYFLEAARQQSFTRAAERLYLAQAALSEQIRNLESELGTRLFDRGHRATTLTPAGEVLKKHAELLLDQALALRRAIDDHIEMNGGRLVIAAIPSVSACLLPGPVAAFRKRHSKMQMSLLEGTSENIATWVDDGRAELGIVQLPTAKGVFDMMKLLEEPFVLLVPKISRVAGKRGVKLSDLAEETFIFYRGRARDTALAACRAAGFEPRIACENTELETIRSLVAANLGVAILPALAARNKTPGCSVVPLSDQVLRRQVALIARPEVTLSPGAVAFRKLLIESIQTP